MQELDAIIAKSLWVSLTEGSRDFVMGPTLLAQNPGKHMLMRDDRRLPKMSANPTLQNFFEYRFASAQHHLRSAQHAQQSGCSEKVVLACLLNDSAVLGFIRGDHGYWGAQLVESYVDEEVSWAIRALYRGQFCGSACAWASPKVLQNPNSGR